MYKQIHGGGCTEGKVDKRLDASVMVPLLQAIFAMLLATGKSLHELPQLIAQSSKLSQPGLLSHPQPEVSPYPRSLCSCNVQSRSCCEVTTAIIGMMTGVVSTANAGVAWLMQTCAAFQSVKERTVRAAHLLGRLRVRLPLTLKD